jgi:hypothetical protein
MKNHLPNSFYTMPVYASTTMRRKDYQDTLLATDGFIMACGSMWDIIGKNMGAGIYRVTLKKKF